MSAIAAGTPATIARSLTARGARRALTTSSNGVFTFARKAAFEKNTGLVIIVRTTDGISPSVRRKVSAARATRPGGGLSETSRLASLNAMCLAVDG